MTGALSICIPETLVIQIRRQFRRRNFYLPYRSQASFFQNLSETSVAAAFLDLFLLLPDA